MGTLELLWKHRGTVCFAVLFILVAGLSVFARHELREQRIAAANAALLQAQLIQNQKEYNAVVTVDNNRKAQENDLQTFQQSSQKAISAGRAKGDGPLSPIARDAYQRVYARQAKHNATAAP